jgi:predicted transposase/invertase (TIGR01784 family)
MKERSMNNDFDFEPRFFSPRNDVAFKKIFGNHLHLTKSFLNSTLRLTGERRIRSLEFIPTEQLPMRAESKKSILDVLCIDEKGSQYIIEVQNKLMANYIQRAQYYAARLYGSQLDAGDNYLALRPVTLLSLLNHAIFPHDVKYLSFHHNIERETQVSYLNEMSYAFVELPKFEKTVDQLETEEDYWIFMMKEATHAREAPEKAPEEVKEAYAILERHTWTRPECLAYEQAKIGLMDDMDSIQTAKEEGIEEGKEIGREEGKEIGRKEEKMNMARAMVSQNLDHGVISTITGLTVAEIESLK